MASSAAALRGAAWTALPAIASAAAYGAYKFDLTEVIKTFFTGPGKYSRIIALSLVLFNWKSLPFNWTVRYHGRPPCAPVYSNLRLYN